MNRHAGPSNVPIVHYDLIASGKQVIKHGRTQDRLSEQRGILCFEMEAAGLMDNFPCLVICEICDYADSHKNKDGMSMPSPLLLHRLKSLSLCDTCETS